LFLAPSQGTAAHRVFRYLNYRAARKQSSKSPWRENQSVQIGGKSVIGVESAHGPSLHSGESVNYVSGMHPPVSVEFPEGFGPSIEADRPDCERVKSARS